jgi:glycosyltransferase involved in cell wall biosynthesis
MGVPSRKIKMGGPTTHLPYLVDFFEKSNQYKIRTFNYGSKVDGGSLIYKRESILSKFFNSVQVFFLFMYLVIVFRPHIIHINSAFVKRSLIRDIPYSLFAFVFRKNLIFKLHGSSYDLINTQNKVYLFLIRLFFLGVKRVGVLSEIERKEFIARFNNAQKLVVVKNIVNTDAKVNGQTGYFERDHTRMYGLFVSRIVEGKGLDDAIRALPSILKTHHNFVLVVAGDGPQKDLCIKLANDLNVNHCIIWLGFVPNEHLPRLISLSDIYIFLSHLPEGMPMSLVEALKYGIPIVTTKVRFAVNYMIENKNCLFIETGNIKDIVEKINQLIDNKELQSRMLIENPKIVEKFSQTIVGKEFEMIYHQMMTSSTNGTAVTTLNQNDSNTINSLQ